MAGFYSLSRYIKTKLATRIVTKNTSVKTKRIKLHYILPLLPNKMNCNLSPVNSTYINTNTHKIMATIFCYILSLFHYVFEVMAPSRAPKAS